MPHSAVEAACTPALARIAREHCRGLLHQHGVWELEFYVIHGRSSAKNAWGWIWALAGLLGFCLLHSSTVHLLFLAQTTVSLRTTSLEKRVGEVEWTKKLIEGNCLLKELSKMLREMIDFLTSLLQQCSSVIAPPEQSMASAGHSCAT